MNVIKIGEKIINTEKVHYIIDKIFEMRSKGYSQQEIASKYKIDRTFVSRLETIGEIRKGGNIAVVGFPVKNKNELTEIIEKHGVGFKLLLSEKERWSFVREYTGADLANGIMDIIADINSYDTVVFIGSDKRGRLVESMLDNSVIAINIGVSPLKQDVYVDPAVLDEILSNIK